MLWGVLSVVGVALMAATIASADREYDQINSPWLWVMLLVGLGCVALGMVMMLY